jgi:hypothetical protein
MNVTPYSYLDLREAISIEKRYTIEDLTFSWQMGYDARIQEERERSLEAGDETTTRAYSTNIGKFKAHRGVS